MDMKLMLKNEKIGLIESIVMDNHQRTSETRFSVREEYEETTQVFKASQPDGNKCHLIKTWVFYYSDGTKESLTMKVINIPHTRGVPLPKMRWYHIT